MEWSEVIASPYFKDLPFKIELNRYGKVEMTPASNKHGRLQLHIGAFLERKLKKGQAITECSVRTENGVSVADVAWCSKAFISQYGYETPYSKAPELCIEIVSPSNSKQEMHNKVSYYLNAGATEVWVVWEQGIVDYYDHQGPLAQSGFGITLSFPKN